MQQVTIGIDIGGTNTVFGIIDQTGNILGRGRIPTTGHLQIETYLEALAMAINTCLEGVNKDIELMGIGIGAPNGNYYEGAIKFAPNLVWKGIIPLKQLVEKHFPNTTIVVDNDANAAAIGEMIYGAAKGMKDFILITLGTGVGSGIVVDGKLVHGHDGFAGELGHTVVTPEGRLCTCGRKGCLEAYAAARGVVQTARELVAQAGFAGLLGDIEKITPKDIFEAAQQGDVIALQTFRETGKALGRKLSDAICYTSPQAIFILGGIASAGTYLFEPTQYYIDKFTLNLFNGKVQLLPSGLDAGNAAILGAGALVWQELNINA